MAEFLVQGQLPASAIQLIATRSEARLVEVDEILGASGVEIPTACRPEWYY